MYVAVSLLQRENTTSGENEKYCVYFLNEMYTLIRNRTFEREKTFNNKIKYTNCIQKKNYTLENSLSQKKLRHILIYHSFAHIKISRAFQLS